MQNTTTLDEIFDSLSDFHVTRHAELAQHNAELANKMIERGHVTFAAFYARKAATEGAQALAIIEERGTDDIEFFC